MSQSPRIPVVMYHSVGNRLPNWLWENLTIEVKMFEEQIHLLKKHEYECTDLTEYRASLESSDISPKRKVVLTFDDGYLDNWVFVYPILKREKWRGTIYVNPEFIDPSEAPRMTLEDVWSGRCSLSELKTHGFLNRAEIRAMQRSGTIEIASHSMSHTWYPTAPNILDFHRPGLDTPWLAWNKQPARKFAYLTEDQSTFEDWGTPIHANGRSLGIRRYFPHPTVQSTAVNLVRAGGGAAFFQAPDWENQLRTAVAPWVGKGRWETNAERADRFAYEIGQSKTALEDITGSPVKHFCWPGGAYDKTSWAMAEAEGFSTISVASSDHERWQSRNPSLMKRVSCASNFAFLGARYYTSDPSFLLTNCELASGVFRNTWSLRLRKFIGAAKTGFSPFKR